MYLAFIIAGVALVGIGGATMHKKNSSTSGSSGNFIERWQEKRYRKEEEKYRRKEEKERRKEEAFMRKQQRKQRKHQRYIGRGSNGYPNTYQNGRSVYDTYERRGYDSRNSRYGYGNSYDNGYGYGYGYDNGYNRGYRNRYNDGYEDYPNNYYEEDFYPRTIGEKISYGFGKVKKAGRTLKYGGIAAKETISHAKDSTIKGTKTVIENLGTASNVVGKGLKATGRVSKKVLNKTSSLVGKGIKIMASDFKKPKNTSDEYDEYVEESEQNTSNVSSGTNVNFDNSKRGNRKNNTESELEEIEIMDSFSNDDREE